MKNATPKKTNTAPKSRNDSCYKEFAKKPALVVVAAVLLFNFFLTLSYFFSSDFKVITDTYEYFKALPVFGFSLFTQLLLPATLILMFIGARFFPESVTLSATKDYLLMITCGVAASEATYYISFIRKEFISFGYTPRHSAFLSILEVIGIAAVCITLMYGHAFPKPLLYTIIICPFAALLRLIPSFVFVRDFMHAKLDALDMSQEDFLTPFFKSLDDPLFTLQLVKILVCFLLCAFAGAVFYHFAEAKNEDKKSAQQAEFTKH